jgi:hypothetical protein
MDTFGEFQTGRINLQTFGGSGYASVDRSIGIKRIPLSRRVNIGVN